MGKAEKRSVASFQSTRQGRKGYDGSVAKGSDSEHKLHMLPLYSGAPVQW